MHRYRNYRRNEHSRIYLGIILFGVGLAVLLRNIGFYLPHWLFTWPMALILIGLYSGLKHRFKYISWLVLMGIGAFFLYAEYQGNISMYKQAFWPMVIMGMGLLFIFRPRSRWVHYRDEYRNRFNASDPGSAPVEAEKEVDIKDEDTVDIKSVFSGVKTKVISKNFKGGNISAVFGGGEIDLKYADMQEPAVLNLEIVFGGLKLIVPSNWMIRNEVEGVFHGVDDKRSVSPTAQVVQDRTLVLKGSVVFGGVDIRSY